jgi:hypothetical protein
LHTSFEDTQVFRIRHKFHHCKIDTPLVKLRKGVGSCNKEVRIFAVEQVTLLDVK